MTDKVMLTFKMPGTEKIMAQIIDCTDMDVSADGVLKIMRDGCTVAACAAGEWLQVMPYAAWPEMKS